MIDSTQLRLLRWKTRLTRSADGSPLISPLFVAEQGRGLRVVDLRSTERARGVLGHIPGSSLVTIERLQQSPPEDTDANPLVIVSATGSRAAAMAKQLEDRGVRYVAAMAGGVAAWRDLGLITSRDPAGIQKEPPGGGEDSVSGPITLDRLREHIGDPRSVRWIKLMSMVAQGRFSCIDGRDERGVIGSPGGDGGEFLLALAAIEQATGGILDDETVVEGLLARLDTFGHFYMHTDVHAFEVMIAAMQADPRLQPFVAGLNRAEEWSAFLRGAAPQLREALLEHLENPAHVGCGHIRLMLQHSDEYGIRRALVRSFLRAFYRLFWEGSPEVQLTTLPGAHGEGAVVNIRLADEIWSLSPIPLISPSCGGRQIFVNHPDVSTYLRRATVQFLARGNGPLSVDPSREGELLGTVNRLAAQQMGVTAGYLAKGLPVFEVLFARDGSFTAREG